MTHNVNSFLGSLRRLTAGLALAAASLLCASTSLAVSVTGVTVEGEQERTVNSGKIRIKVELDSDITADVVGSPYILLDKVSNFASGVSEHRAVFAGDGRNFGEDACLYFDYDVQAGDYSSGIDVKANGILNGATITTAAGTVTSLVLPTGTEGGSLSDGGYVIKISTFYFDGFVNTIDVPASRCKVGKAFSYTIYGGSTSADVAFIVTAESNDDTEVLVSDQKNNSETLSTSAGTVLNATMEASKGGTMTLTVTPQAEADNVTIRIRPSLANGDTSADLTLILANITVNSPTISRVFAVEDRAFGNGEAITIGVEFSERITRLSGRPLLYLNVQNQHNNSTYAANNAYANYAVYDTDYPYSGKIAYFTYKVKPGDYVSDLDATRLALNGGSITCSSGPADGTTISSLPKGTNTASLASQSDVSIQTVFFSDSSTVKAINLTDDEGQSVAVTVTRSAVATEPQNFTIRDNTGAEAVPTTVSFSATPVINGAASLTTFVLTPLAVGTETIRLRPTGYTDNGGDLVLNVTVSESTTAAKLQIAGVSEVSEGSGTFTLQVKLNKNPKATTVVRVTSSNPASLAIVDCDAAYGTMDSGVAVLTFPPDFDHTTMLSLTLNPRDGLDPEHNTIEIKAVDPSNTYASYTHRVTVENVNPRFSQTMRDEDGAWEITPAAAKSPTTIFWSASDASAVDMAAPLTAHVAFGDGTEQDVTMSPSGSGSVQHTYAAANLAGYTVTVTVMDKDGGSASIQGNIVVTPPTTAVIQEYKRLEGNSGRNTYTGASGGAMQGMGEGSIVDDQGTEREALHNFFDWKAYYNKGQGAVTFLGQPADFEDVDPKTKQTATFNSFFHVWLGDFYVSQNVLDPTKHLAAAVVDIGEDTTSFVIEGVFSREHYPEDGTPDIDWDELPDEWEEMFWPGELAFEDIGEPHGKMHNPDSDFLPACVASVLTAPVYNKEGVMTADAGDFVMKKDNFDFSPVGIPYVNVYEARGTHYGLNMAAEKTRVTGTTNIDYRTVVTVTVNEGDDVFDEANWLTTETNKVELADLPDDILNGAQDDWILLALEDGVETYAVWIAETTETVNLYVAEPCGPQDEPHFGSYDEAGNFADDGAGNAYYPFYGTDPTSADTDGDGLPDGYEYFFWRIARFAGRFSNNPIGYAYDPTQVIVGTPIDAAVIEAAFNPCVPGSPLTADTDGDGLSDFEEMLLGTNPVNWDTDGDTMNDGWEVKSGLDPKNPKDGQVDYSDNAATLCNPDGDWMALDPDGLRHFEIYAEYGFDPRTAWTQYYTERNRMLTMPAPNTMRFINYEEHYLARFCIDKGVVGEVEPMGGLFMTQPTPAGTSRFYDPSWNGNANHVPNHGVTPTESPGAADASSETYAVPFGDLSYLVASLEIGANGCDTDGDGMPDGWELYAASEDGQFVSLELWPLGHPALDHIIPDFDMDGLGNGYECHSVELCDMYYTLTSAGSNNTAKAFANMNGNWYNKWWPTDPWNPDTDGDCLLDSQEGDSTFRYQESLSYSAETPSVEAQLKALTFDGISFGFTTMLRGHVPGGGLNPCAVDTDMDYLPDPWEYQFAGTLRDEAWAGGFKDDDGIQTHYENAMLTVSANGYCGMDGTYFDSRSGYDEHTHRERSFDYDGDGLENYQEYFVNGVRHFQYDKWAKGGDYGSYDPQAIFDTGVIRENKKLGYYAIAGGWAGQLNPVFIKWDWSAYADDWQNNNPIMDAPENMMGIPFYPFSYMPPEIRPYPLGFYSYASTDPRTADSDEDNMDDYWEVFHGLNPILSDMMDWVNQPMFRPPDVYDFNQCPWLAGMPNADPDQDGLPNWEEALSPNQPAPANHNTDPSPLWFTDLSYERSFVNLYYNWGSVGNFWTVETTDQYEYFPTPSLMFPLMTDPRPSYVYSFESNEGFDTDNDNLSDRYEVNGEAGGVTDPQNADRPAGRKALYLDGDSAARTRSLCAFGPNAFRSWTLEAWVLPENPASGKMQVILERPVAWVDGDGTPKYEDVRRTFRLGLLHDGRPFVEFNNGGKDFVTEQASASEGAALEAGKWYHLAATMDGFKGELTLFCNGERIATKPTTAIPYTGFTTSAYNAPGEEYHHILWAPLVIGASDANPVGKVDGSYYYQNGAIYNISTGQPDLADFFTGWVDEVRIWDGARPGGHDLSDQRIAFWRWSSIRDDYDAMKRYGFDETLAAREEAVKQLVRMVAYRRETRDIESVTAVGGTVSNAFNKSWTLPAEGMTFDEYYERAVYFLQMTGGEDNKVRIPPMLACVYNFDSLPDPNYESVTPAKFASLNGRPMDYNGVPWWRGAVDRSTVYTSSEAPYLFPQYIQNLVSMQPLGHLVQAGMDEEYGEIVGGAPVPLFKYRPDYVINSKYWTRDTKGGKALGEFQIFGEASGLTSTNVNELFENAFPNNANPYGLRYETALVVDEESHPQTLFLEKYDHGYATLFNDLVPLRGAYADMAVQLWDDHAGDGIGVNADTDGDGLPDWWEIANGLDPHNADQDGNGVRDDKDDFDGDGLANYFEMLAGTDPLDATTDSLVRDGGADPDGDGLTNAQEEEMGTHPLRADSDDDGVNDGHETMYGTNPLDALDPYQPRAIYLDGADGTQISATAERYQVEGSFTLSAWVRPVAYPAEADATVVAYEIGDGVYNYFIKVATNGVVTAGFSGRDGSDGFALSAPVFRALPLNAWTRVGFTYNYEGRLATLDFDGEQVASSPVLARPAVYNERILKPVTIGTGFAGFVRNVSLAAAVDGAEKVLMNVRFDDGTSFDAAGGVGTYGADISKNYRYQAEDFALATTNVPYGSMAYRLLPETAASIEGSAVFVDLDENLEPMMGNLDTDGDGLPDWWEIENGLNPFSEDTDGDGILDGDEDDDLDGLTNAFECLAGTDPHNAKTDGSTFDGDADGDGDGLANRLEQLYGTDPSNPDTDDDGITDGDEVFGNGLGHFTLPTSALSPARAGAFRADGSNAAQLTGGNENDAPSNDAPLAGLRLAKSWTVEAWVKGATDGVIVRRGVADGAVNYELGLEGGKPYARIAGVYDGAVDPALAVKASADFALASDKWVHLAAVWNDDTRVLALYVDGVLAANVYKREIDLGVFAQDGLAPVTVGDGLTGFVDELRIWDVARSGASIAATAYQTFECAAVRPVVELRFDDFGETAENFGTAGGFLATDSMLGGAMGGQYSPIADDEFVDADADGIPDFWEIAIFGSVMACDPAGDEDGDGLSNLYEYYAASFPLTKYTGDANYGTGENAPLVSDANRDLDGDGLTNLQEQNAGTRPDMQDTDGDGWTDYEEVNGVTRGRTPVGVSDPVNPLSPAIPRAAKFDGTGRVVAPGRTGRWLREWTVAAWIRPDANMADGSIAAQTYADGSVNYAIGVENVSGVLTPYAKYTAEFADGQLADVKVGVAEGAVLRDNNADWLTLKSGKWTHIAATYTGANEVGSVTNGLLTIYVDGTPVAWRTDALAGPFNGSGLPFNGEFAMGENFTGLIDDVRVVASALSEEGVVTLMGAGQFAAAPTKAAKMDEAHAAAAPAKIEGEYIVRFRDGITKTASTSTVAALGGVVKRTYSLINAAHVAVPQGADAEAFVAALEADPSVLYVEPNRVRTLFTAPNDADYSRLWGMRNDGQTGGTAGCDIDAETAWDYTTGSKDIVVAVIDSGVDYNHPDLADNMWVNAGEIAGNGLDDDGNGLVDDVYGYDFANDDADPMDDHSHGTHCAGTIGAVGNNGKGVAGVNWKVKIMACKAATAQGSLPTSAIVAAIEYATLMGAHVSNNSYGGYGFSQAEYDAVKAAGEAGMVFVAAAGNEANDNDGPYQAYPASFNLDCVIAVAATDHNDGIAYFSNYGATTVDLGAPGVDIYSTIPTSMGSYGLMSGTSMATPHVTGAAALILAADPTLTVSAVKRLLMDYADPIESLDGMCVSGARLNIGAAIPAVLTPGGGEPGVGGRGLVANYRFDGGTAVVHDFARAFSFARPTAYAAAAEGGATLVTDADEDLELFRFFADSDGDSLPDWWEEMVGFSPLSAVSGGRNGDDDGDGLSNFFEFRASLAMFGAGLRGLDPFNPDTDNDGISDYDEDSDGDGLTNGEEQDTYLSDPGAADSDDDAENDGGELATGFDPTDAYKPFVSRALTFSGAANEKNEVVVRDKVDGRFTERFSSSEWTVEAWVNPASGSLGDRSQFTLVRRRLFATGAANYEVGLKGGRPYALYADHEGGHTVEVSAAAKLPAGAWTHVAARLETDAQTGQNVLTLFVDGVPVAMADSRLAPATGPGDLVFGSSGFKGQMFGIRVWKVAQPDSSIKGMMQSELLGGTIEGMSGVLTVNGSGFLKESATTLQANGDPIDVLENNWTVECWLKTTANSGIVMARRNSSETTLNDFNYCIQMNADGSLRGRFAIWFLYVDEYDEDGNPKRYATMFNYSVNDIVGEMRVNDGNWHHIAYVRSATQCKLYVDGILDASQASFYLPAGYDIVDYGIRAIAGPVVVGEHLAASIDETRIWNRDLSTAEIKSYSHQNLTGAEPGLISYFNFDFEAAVDSVMEHAVVRDNELEKGIFIRTTPEEAFIDTETAGPENFRNSPIRSLQNLSLSGIFVGRDGGETLEDRTNPMAYGDFLGVKYAGVLGSGVSFAAQNPLSWTERIDSDGDGMSDRWEVSVGLDPYNSDQDSNGTVDAWDDFDADGLGNYSEFLAGTDPANPDSDADGKSDYTDSPYDGGLTYGELFSDNDYVRDSYEQGWEASYASPFRFDEHLDRDLDGWDNWSEALAGTRLEYNAYNESSETIDSETGEVVADATAIFEATVADKAENFPMPTLTATLDYQGDAITGAKLVVHAYTDAQMNGWPDAVLVKDFSGERLDTWPMTVDLTKDDVIYGHLRQGKNWFFAWMETDGSSLTDNSKAGDAKAVNGGNWPTWTPGEPAAVADFQVNGGIDIGWDRNEVSFHLADEARGYIRYSFENPGNGAGTVAGFATDGKNHSVITKLDGVGSTMFSKTLKWPRVWLHEGDMQTGRTSGYGVTLATVNERAPNVYRVYVDEYDGGTTTNWFTKTLAKPTLVSPVDYEVVYAARPEFKFVLPDEATEFEFSLTRETETETREIYKGRLPAPLANGGGDNVVVWRFPYSSGSILPNGLAFEMGCKHSWRVVAYNAANGSGSAVAAGLFKTATAEQAKSRPAYGFINAKVVYPSGWAYKKSFAPKLLVRAYETASFNNPPASERRLSSPGAVTLYGLDANKSYYLMAFVDQDAGYSRSAWEPWGYYRDPLAVEPFRPVAVKASASGNENPYEIVLRDPDTDDDLIPDSIEYVLYSASYPTAFLSQSGASVSSVHTRLSAALTAYAALLSSQPGSGGDADKDGVSDLEELVYGLDPTESDSSGDGLDDGDAAKLFGSAAAAKDVHVLSVTSIKVDADGNIRFEWGFDGDTPETATPASATTLAASPTSLYYVVMATDSLENPNWQPIGAPVPADSTAAAETIADAMASGESGTRFFKVVLKKAE